MLTVIESDLKHRYQDLVRPVETVEITDWAEEHLFLSPKVTNFPGPYRADLTPYSRGIFEAFRDPGIEVLYLAWGGQTAKTTTELVCLLYTIGQDPGSALWVMPNETLARSFSENRMQPLIDDTPTLAKEKPVDADRYKILEMQLRRCVVTLVGANSPANLSSRPIRYLFADEVDKFPIQTVREGSALNLSIRRTVSFWNRKIVISSTPTTADGQIWHGLLSADWREFWVPCPFCGEMQTLTFPNIRKPEKLEDPDEIRAVAWYECAFCHKRIENRQKPAMLAAGEWRPKAEPMREFEWTPPRAGGTRASFHLPSWYSPWIDFGDVLARFIQAKAYPEDLHEIINQDLAEPWEERGEAKREEDILVHRSEYNPGTIPSGAEVLAIIQTVDVQAEQLFYVVRAWGPHEESWLLDYGVLADLSDVAPLLERQYLSTGSGAAGERGLDLCIIDSGYKTDEVYAFCLMHNRCIPVKGTDRQLQPVRWTTLDRMPDGKAIPGGLRLLTTASEYYKDALMNRLNIKRGDPGFWHVHAETGEDYARQLVAEIVVEKKDARGRIQRIWKQVRRDNHYLDCECYQLAGARILDVRFRRQGPQRRRTTRVDTKRKPWVGKTEGWI